VAVIFLENWQHECCGRPFATAEVVTWPLTTDLGRDHLGTMLGSEVSARLTAYVERHSEQVVETRLRVNAIRAVFCEYAPDPDGEHPQALRPVPGTAAFQEMDRVEHRSESLLGMHWVGYVVDAEPAS
jgi:hypothetical protein